MSAGGVLDPRRVIKLTWGAIMGGVAAILLQSGGLDALQNGAIRFGNRARGSAEDPRERLGPVHRIIRQG
jgi:BCCT, betaine/carnitine/choline family transporter